eukprot:11033299-Lingulodinium_polyedra.AAC.1
MKNAARQRTRRTANAQAASTLARPPRTLPTLRLANCSLHLAQRTTCDSHSPSAKAGANSRSSCA